MAFKVIETQEELDAIIRERLERAEKKYEGFMSAEDVQKMKDTYEASVKADNEKYSALEKEKEDLMAKVKGYEVGTLKTKVALANNLPIGATDYLKGETEEELTESAKALSSMFTPKGADHKPKEEEGKPLAPQGTNTQGATMSEVEKRFMELNPNLKV
jgi:hypothetical protein|nr:MAG TPA: Major head protein [Caudoviricetes sp.]